MNDKQKTKQDLIAEVERLRARNRELERLDTKRKEAEKKLLDQNQLLATLVSVLPDEIYAKDLQGRFILVNNALVKQFGVNSEEDLLGKSDFDLIPYKMAKHLHEEEKQILTSGQGIIKKPISNARTKRWILTTKIPLYDETNEPMGLVGVNYDITDYKLTDLLLKQEEARFHAFTTAMPDMACILDADASFLHVYSSQIQDYFPAGVDPHHLTMLDVFPASVAKAHQKVIQETIQTGECQTLQYYLKLNEEDQWFEARTSLIPPSDLHPIRVVWMVRNFTEHKRLQNDLLSISENEQRRIGNDLHDGLGQQLTGIALMLRVLCTELETDSVAAHERATIILSQVNKTISDARKLSRGLCPVDLEDDGLCRTLQNLVSQIRNVSSISCKLDMDSDIHVNNSEMATHIYRIAQEALNNAVRHSHATAITLSLQQDGNKQIYLTIEDNGRGQAKDILNGRGLGIRTMMYRAGTINGQLDVQDVPTGGIRIGCRFPND